MNVERIETLFHCCVNFNWLNLLERAYVQSSKDKELNSHVTQQFLSMGYIQGPPNSVQTIYLYSYIHFSTIYNSQYLKTFQMHLKST